MSTLTLENRTAIGPNPGAGFATGTIAVATRALRKFFRTPQLVVLGTLQGSMFLLIFRYVFGGAVGQHGSLPFVDFLVPGFVVTSVLFTAMNTAAGVAEDMEQGFVDRLKSLPMFRSSVIAGRSLADVVTQVWTTAIVVAIGFAVGFRLHTTALHALAAFALCIVYAAAFGFVFILIGLVSGTAQAAQGMSMIVFPLTFVSSAYVPVQSMPGWLQVIAQRQPLTMMSDAVRGLTEGARAHAVQSASTGHYVVLSLIWSVGIAAVFGALSVARFSRR